MGVRTLETEAIVLRTLKYGEADVIAHLFTREGGRRNVIAKGARRQKSRLGARLEPFLVVRLQLREGRGDLALVQGVEVLGAHEHVRQSWAEQQTGAVALDMLSRMSVEESANDSAYHLTTKFLGLLDSAGTSELAREAVLAGYELKLLHLTGIAPHLGSCTRCGSPGPLTSWSASDGGVICAACREPNDAAVDPEGYAAAVHAMQTALGALAAEREPAPGEDPALAAIDIHAYRAARRRIVEPMCVEHAGFRPRSS